MNSGGQVSFEWDVVLVLCDEDTINAQDALKDYHTKIAAKAAAKLAAKATNNGF